jgi:hypothetical protein
MWQSFDLLPTNTSLNADEGIMLQVLSILTSATVEVKRGKTGEFIRVEISIFTHHCSEKIFKQLSGKNEVDKALQKLLESMQDPSALKEFPKPSTNVIPPAGIHTLVCEPRTLF